MGHRDSDSLQEFNPHNLCSYIVLILKTLKDKCPPTKGSQWIEDLLTTNFWANGLQNGLQLHMDIRKGYLDIS